MTPDINAKLTEVYEFVRLAWQHREQPDMQATAADLIGAMHAWLDWELFAMIEERNSNATERS
jgi:hypothetical protein